MSPKFSPEEIRKYWTDQARQHCMSPVASWSDRMVIEMEIREIIKYLKDGDRVLDIGCANGFSTAQFASLRRITARGIDYIPEMIEQARTRARGIQGCISGTLEFDVGDITDLHEPADAFDKVIVIRVIINLGNWDNQAHGLLAAIRAVKPGGLLLLSEATLQGWRRLNRFREEWGLPEIPMPPFNNYLDETRVVELLSKEADLVGLLNFASTYYVGTRVFKPLAAQIADASVDVANPDMEWNRFFAALPQEGDYGIQKLLVFRKR